MLTPKEKSKASAPPGGQAVDKSGGPVIDPTANVISLVIAETRRQDDLRLAESLRVDQLRVAESRRLDEMASIRAHYDEKLREAEAKRIDAIRAVDVAAVAVASEKAADQATVLANQVSASAEALRALVANTATNVATSLAQLNAALSTRLTTLEQGSYQAQGRSTLADPAYAGLVTKIDSLTTSQNKGEGKSEGVSGLVAGAIALLTLLAGGLLVYVARPPTQAVPVYAQPSGPGYVQK